MNLYMMRSTIVISLVTALALGAPAPVPLEVGLGIPAVVVDGHPIKIPQGRRGLSGGIDVQSKISIGDHTIDAGGGAVSIGGHAVGGSVGNDPGSSISIHTRNPEALNTRHKKRSFRFISGTPAIGIGESAVGGSVLLSGGPEDEPVSSKHGAGIANGGNGGDALVANSRAGNGGNAGIVIGSPK